MPSPAPVKKTGSFFRFKNPLTKYSYVAFLLFIIVLSLLVIAANIFEKPINRKVLSAVQGQLKTSLKVQHMSLSLIRAFPNAAVELSGVSLKDPFGKPLIEANRISLRFSMFSLLGSDISIRSLIVADGQVRIHTDSKGRHNYDIFKTTSNNTANSDIGFSLASAQIQNLRLQYADDRSHNHLDITLEKAQAKGNFSATRFITNSQAALTINNISDGKQQYLKGKHLSCEAEIEVDMKNRIYKLKDALLSLESSVVSLDGAFQAKQDYTFCDLKIKNKNTSLPTLLQLLPNPYADYFQDFKSTGHFDLRGAVKGRFGASYLPDIQLVMQMHDATIRSPKLEDALENVNFKATLQHNSKNSFFEVSGFQGQFGRHPLSLQLKVTDLKEPYVDFRFNGVFPLASAFGLLNNPAITDGDGKLVFRDLQLKGRYRDMIQPKRIHQVVATGNIAMKEVALTINKEAVAFPSGMLTLDNNLLKLDSFRIEGAGTSLVLNGYCRNLLPVLFADSLNSQNATLDFNSNLYAKSIDIDKLLALVVRQQKAEKSSATAGSAATRSRRVSPVRLLKGTFDAQIDELNYDLIETRDFSGKLDFENGDMSVNGDLEGMGGTFNVEGTMDLDIRTFDMAVECEDVNITEFFRQCRNFYQDFIEDKNLKGQLNAQMLVKGAWSQDFILDQDRLHVFADLSVNNGELIRFKMLDAFSKYVKIQDLQHIKFSNLRNWVEIRKRTIYMPAIFVQSNAANLTFSGNHTFDQRINYNILVNAGQVLMSKFKKFDHQLKPQPAEKGWFNLYYNIYGSTSNYRFRMAKNTVLDEFKAGEFRKKIIQQELSEVFGNHFPEAAEDNRKPATTAGKLLPLLPGTNIKKNTTKPAPDEAEEEDYYVPGF